MCVILKITYGNIHFIRVVVKKLKAANFCPIEKTAKNVCIMIRTSVERMIKFLLNTSN